MASDFLIRNLSQGANPTAESFAAKSQELQGERDRQAREQQAEQDRKDNQIHQVIKYAADGYTDEARFLAQQHGLQVPDAIFRNGDFARASALVGDLYGATGEQDKGQKFLAAYMQVPGDAVSRYRAAVQAAGLPMGKSEYDLQKLEAELKLKQKYATPTADQYFTLGEGQSRYDAAGNVVASGPPKRDTAENKVWTDAYNRAIEASTFNLGIDPAETANAALAEYRQQFDGGAQPPAAAPATTLPTIQQQGLQQRAVYTVQQAAMEGYTAEQIKASLIQKGIGEEQAQALLSAAGVQ